MRKIQRLSPSLINKIAAGEVIERPASVVKELMENAVDAGATRIDVRVEGGGAELVRVVDSGGGIAADELMLAVASHATSKLAEADDLFRVATLGFRGEALASIAEVSRLTIRSRTADSASGAEIEVVGGTASEVSPCGCPVGTTVEVRNLFFNTPVRRKFLRSKQTELGHTSEAVTRIALARPDVHFTLGHNQRQTLDLPGGQDWRARIAAVAGRSLAEGLIWVESEHGDVQLSGYVAHPSHSRGNSRMQYLFLNGRYIRDRALQHALSEAYRGLLLTGRYPIAFLRLDMPPELVDVNVHPTKLEVRFQNADRLYSQLLSTLRAKFLSADLTARVESVPDDDPAGAHDEGQTAQVRQQVVDWAKGEIASWERPSTGGAGGATSAGSAGAGQPAPLELTRLGRAWPPAEDTPDDQPPTGSHAAAWARGPHATGPAPEAFPDAPLKAMQVHNRYLVTETEEGVMVIDQHALHERILYEQLRARVTSGAVESQRLLVPEPVDLSPAEAAAVLEHQELLAKLGVRIEPFGGDTILVAGYPAMLANMNPGEVLRGLVDRLLAGGRLPDQRDLLDDLLHTIACKAAIKAGDRLAPEEIEALLARRHLIDDAHHCPHGRPTAVIFSREELDRQFKRV